VTDKQLKELGKRLSTPYYQAFAEQDGDLLKIRWVGEIKERRLVDIQHPDSVGEATVRFFDGGVEWETFLVEPDAQRHGIFTAGMRLPQKFCEEWGRGAPDLAGTANDSHFYQQAGFRVSDENPYLMVKDPQASQDWVRCRSR
jgi:GNAT superfamily N-acetyltransferase